jgi:DNA polymerase-1
MISRLRKITKLTSTYFDVAYDKDERIRCHHKICGTVSGRISTQQTFFGTGANLQNQPPAFKKFLCADDGSLLCEVDLARAEAHVVAYLCQDHNMMEAFESKVDVHTFNASKIFHVEMEDVTKTQRNLGKRVVHASNYGMGPQTFSDNLAKDDWFVPPKECKELLNAYASRFPGLKRWHKEIDDTLYRTRTLYNLFGRPKRFLGRLDAATTRSAYSYIPQSTVAELLNRGMIKLYDNPTVDHTNYRMLATVHDSVVLQIPFRGEATHESIHHLLEIVSQELTHTFVYAGREFTIGLDAKLGFTWAGGTIELHDFSLESIDHVLTELGV